MTDEDALLRTIGELPDEDTPRLVFADYLSEQGGEVNIAWASLIRVQVKVAAGVADEELLQRCRLLLSPYWRERIAERMGVPGSLGLKLDAWSRGFPEFVEGSFPVVRRHWKLLLRRLPISRVRITGIDNAKVADFATWPLLERIRELDLSTWDGIFRPKPRPLGFRGVAAIAGCPALAGLKSLTLSFLAIGQRVADLILNSPHLAGLKFLILRRNTSIARPSELVVERFVERFGPNVIQ